MSEKQATTARPLFCLYLQKKPKAMRNIRIWSWVAAAALAMAGCTSGPNFYPPTGGGNGNGGGRGGDNTPQEKLTERTDWEIGYKGRADYTEEDGTVSRVEEFSFNYTGNGYFIVRVLTPDDMKNYYDNDLKLMLEGEVKEVVTQAENEGRNFYENSTVVFDSGVRTVYFDLIIHGDYTAYLIEIDKNGKPTYNYAKAAVTVVEENPSEGFLKWIGNWRVGDGNVSYDIAVSSCEANYLYYIDGWETGEAVQEQMTMDRDWIFARFRKADASLCFYGQYLMSYEDESLQDADGNNVWVDQMFVGTYLSPSSDSNGEVDKEGAYAGYDIAYTVTLSDGKVVIEPESFTFDNDFKAVYHSMRYSRFCYDEENWAHYNDSGVPTFTNHTMTMTQLQGTRASSAVRTRTKEMFRRTQPQAHTARRMRK